MLYLTSPFFVEGDRNVAEVRVFDSPEGVHRSESTNNSLTDIPGLLFKLRAVWESDGKRVAIIRRGSSSFLVWKSSSHYDSIDEALTACLSELRKCLNSIKLSKLGEPNE